MIATWREAISTLVTDGSPELVSAIPLSRDRAAWLTRLLLALLFVGGGVLVQAQEASQEEQLDRPFSESFETDTEADSIPDGWYNIRDAALADGGPGRSKVLRFANSRPGRPARASRAFGINGEATGALVVGMSIRLRSVLPGERLGEEPQFLIGLLADDVEMLAEPGLGPWSAESLGDGWVKVARRIVVPPRSRHAIVTIGLMGATGTLEIDDLTIAPVPRAPARVENLVLNGDLEWGDPAPSFWETDPGASRVSPGHESDAALELGPARASATIGLGVPVRRFNRLNVQLSARAQGLRGTVGAFAELVYLDDRARLLPGGRGQAILFRWTGSAPWKIQQVRVDVPEGARWAAFRVVKTGDGGSLTIDDLVVTSAPDPSFGAWTPFQAGVDPQGWTPYHPADAILPGSALDFSFLFGSPPGPPGRVTVQNGHLVHADGSRARFFGVSLIPPVPFLEATNAEALADRLARSGVNLVRIGGLDLPLGTGLSALDDSRDDTRVLDAAAVGRLQHLVASLEKRGLAVALELQAGRRFREADGIPAHRLLPPGGGPTAAFAPELREAALEMARKLLESPNPGTGTSLAADPGVAWIALAAELSLFDLEDAPDALPEPYAAALRSAVERRSLAAGRRSWQALESEQWSAEAKALRATGVQALLAGSAHWRREPEFVAAQTSPGLDLVDDRLFWSPSPWVAPDRRSLLWDSGSEFAEAIRSKRKPDRPYVLGQWGVDAFGAWGHPYDPAELLFVTHLARAGDWDGVIRQGVAMAPAVWGAAAAGTGGAGGHRTIPNAINSNPAVFTLLPHAASLFLRPAPAVGPASRASSLAPGWLTIDTPHTKAVVGWPAGRRPVRLGDLVLEVQGEFGVLAVSSVGPEPIAEARRLLVTAVARAQPSGFAWTDEWRRDVADPGHPPLLVEPVRGSVLWLRPDDAVTAYPLDASGRRLDPFALTTTPDGRQLALDGRAPGLSWELVIEPGSNPNKN